MGTDLAEGEALAEVTRDLVRHSFQRAMEDRFRTVVEGATGRKVIANLSQIHTDPDLPVELFVLEPVAHVEHANGGDPLWSA